MVSEMGAADSGHDEVADGKPNPREFQFETPEEKVSLNANLNVYGESSILDQDERLKARLDLALDTMAEQELIKFLDMDVGPIYKRKILLTLGQIYENQESDARIMALYEKFIIEFPSDKEVPKLYLKLGQMYRDAGAVNTALAKFYNVLNVALSVSIEELKDYQEVSHRAQLEIAETFFTMGTYDQAAKFYKRLLRLDLVDEDHENVAFRYAYTIYLAGDYNEATVSLGGFLNKFETSELAAEARYLLSEAYMRLNDPKSALQETLELLHVEAQNMSKNPDAWLYWKKRTGNRLANQFYKEDNYLDALSIYQAMLPISRDPTWTWPVLYQIGLCYEKLDMKPKAVDAFEQIVANGSRLTEAQKDDRTLMSIHEMAQWRTDRLGLDMDMEMNLRRVLNNE
jgi:tetratricopeptide (TPR) repeat protein